MTKLKVRGLKWKTVKVRGSVLHFCQKNNWKVTVHAFGIVHKPKITIHGQWTVPDTHPEKKKKKKNEKRNARNAIPKRHLYAQVCLFNFILNTSWSTRAKYLTKLLIQVWFIYLLIKLEFVCELHAWLTYSFLIYSINMTNIFFLHFHKSRIFIIAICIINKRQIIIWYHMSLFTNLYSRISSLYKYIFRQVYIKIQYNYM